MRKLYLPTSFLSANFWTWKKVKRNFLFSLWIEKQQQETTTNQTTTTEPQTSQKNRYTSRYSVIKLTLQENHQKSKIHLVPGEQTLISKIKQYSSSEVMPPDSQIRFALFCFMVIDKNLPLKIVSFCKSSAETGQVKWSFPLLEMANNENLSAAHRQITAQEVTGLFLRALPNAFALFNFLRYIKKKNNKKFQGHLSRSSCPQGYF